MTQIEQRTILRCGASIRDILMQMPAVAGKKITKIYPIVADNADLPYIVYRRASMDGVPVKNAGSLSATTTQFDIAICTETYAQGVLIAEEVIRQLDGVAYVPDPGDSGCAISRCTFAGSEGEDWEANAYVQYLTFNVRC